jgi:transposase
MNKNEQFEYKIISEYLEKKISRRDASVILSLSERTITRKAKNIEIKGVLGVKHSNIGKDPVNKINNLLKETVLQLVRDIYFDFNISHCLEMLCKDNNIKISYSTLRRWCHEIHMVKNKKRRSSKVRKRRERMKNPGLLLQMDGSHHKFNGRNIWCLIAAIDDATSEIPYAEFFLSEDSINCMTVLQKIIELKGIPYAVYVDRAGWFRNFKRTSFTQFTRACDELNIRVIYAGSAQAKGRIERAWKTFQDRLIPEMRLRDIKKIPTANYYLKNQFIANYWNKRCVVPATDIESMYRTLPRDLDLNEIFCVKEFRKINYDHTINWNGQMYKIASKLTYSIAKQELEIRTYQNLKWKAYYADKIIKLEPIKKIKPKNQLRDIIPGK